ncbi:MAG: hypothetical protein IKA55_00105 [Akkermansia sp.]|nr:hypothetical protein [Akkermansia sp.]
MRNRVRKLLGGLCLLAALAAPAAQAKGDSWTLSKLTEEFSNVNDVGRHVCLVHDGWQLAFFSDDRIDIGAIFISEQPKHKHHQHNMEQIARRAARLIGMSEPQILELEESKRKTAIVIDQKIISRLAERADHALTGSPLAGMAFLLEQEYFYIHNLRPNGYLHWKTVKKSGVELLMPMAPDELSAIEVVGRQYMDDYACGVLARKLGLGGNTAPRSRRIALSQEMGVFNIPYMNTSSGILAAHKDRRVIFGKKSAVNHMFHNRYGGTLLYPSQACDWPKPKEEPRPTELTPEPEKKEAPPLTPAEARKAYEEYLRTLGA